MQRNPPLVLRPAAALGLALLIAACGTGDEDGDGASLLSGAKPDPLAARLASGRENRTAAGRPNRTQPDMREAPHRFSAREEVLWDGKPTLEGLWVAHADTSVAERVRIRNPRTGTVIDGALLPRRTAATAGRTMISAEAADALGLLPGVPAVVELVAIEPEGPGFEIVGRSDFGDRPLPGQPGAEPEAPGAEIAAAPAPDVPEPPAATAAATPPGQGAALEALLATAGEAPLALGTRPAPMADARQAGVDAYVPAVVRESAAATTAVAENALPGQPAATSGQNGAPAVGGTEVAQAPAGGAVAAAAGPSAAPDALSGSPADASTNLVPRSARGAAAAPGAASPAGGSTPASAATARAAGDGTALATRPGASGPAAAAAAALPGAAGAGGAVAADGGAGSPDTPAAPRVVGEAADRGATPSGGSASPQPAAPPFVPAVVRDAAAAPPAPAAESGAPAADPRLPDGKPYLQAGYFAVQAHAADLVRTLAAYGIPARNVAATVDGKALRRVVAGPFSSAEARDRALERIEAIGITDAVPSPG